MILKVLRAIYCKTQKDLDMIDFVKVYYTDKEALQYYVENEEEIFTEVNRTLEIRSGEIKYPLETNYQKMFVKILEKRGFVQNSLHKFFDHYSGNNGENYSDFKYSSLLEVISHLEKNIIGIGLQRITNLEFGINIEVPRPPMDIIKENILMHKYHIHKSLNTYNGNGYLKQFNHTNYIIKVYDKGKQYGLGRNLLRFEIRFTKSKLLNQLMVYNLQSLKNKEVLKNLMSYLIKRFDEMQIVDEAECNLLDSNGQVFYDQCSSYVYWQQVKKKSYTTISRKKKCWETFLEEKDLLTTKKLLRLKLVDKFKYLINN